MNFGSLAATAVKVNQLGSTLSSGLGAPGQSSFTKNQVATPLESAKTAKSTLTGLTVTKTLEGLNSFGQTKTKTIRSFSERTQNKNLQNSFNSMGILSKRI